MRAALNVYLRFRFYLRLCFGLRFRFDLKLVPRAEEQPQGLKPAFLQTFAARMNPCPDNHALARVNRFLLHGAIGEAKATINRRNVVFHTPSRPSRPSFLSLTFKL